MPKPVQPKPTLTGRRNYRKRGLRLERLRRPLKLAGPRCIVTSKETNRIMYGVPAQLDLAPFVGATLDNIGLAKCQIQFIFGGDLWTGKKCVVAVEGYWEMRNAQSVLIDKAIPPDERDAYRIHSLLSRTVTDAKVNPPESFTLVFDNGWTLTFVDDSPQYESCHVYVGESEIHI